MEWVDEAYPPGKISIFELFIDPDGKTIHLNFIATGNEDYVGKGK